MTSMKHEIQLKSTHAWSSKPVNSANRKLGVMEFVTQWIFSRELTGADKDLQTKKMFSSYSVAQFSQGSGCYVKDFSEDQFGRERNLLWDVNPGWQEVESFWSNYSRVPSIEFPYVVRSYTNTNLKSQAKFSRKACVQY